ncbi:MAG TPA: 50S ribosomal protein L18e [Nitrososphaerales archaeon]|nr:50S ribosomal protein L18e [Nitrososphaerales archaeon]
MSSTNPLLRQTVVLLERAGKDAAVWRSASQLLSSPALTKVEVNVGRISRLSEGGAKLLVPGKVLGWGNLDKKVTVGAFSFSSSAKQKITAAGGSAITIGDFVKKYRDGRNVKIVK